MTERLDPWEIYAEDPPGVGSPVARHAMQANRVAVIPGNPEGAPTLVYEIWYDWDQDPGKSPERWQWIGYRTLSKRQVLEYRGFGYTVIQSRRASRDHCGTPPLFPIVGTSAEYPTDGVD